MAKTVLLNMRIDEETKTGAEAIYAGWGLSLREAVTVFLRQSIKAGGFPFDLRTREENAAAPDTLDFTEEKAISAAEKAVGKERAKTVPPALAKKAVRVFTAEEIEEYTAKLDTLTAGAADGSVARLSYEQVAGLGIPEEFMRQYWNMTPQHMLSVEVNEEEVFLSGPETIETETDANTAHEEQVLSPAGRDLDETLGRIEGVLASFGVPISVVGQQDDETLAQFTVRFGAAVQAALAKLPRGQRRQAHRSINKEMDHFQARLAQE